MTRQALAAVMSYKFGLKPNLASSEAVDLQAYWEGEAIDDYRMPPEHLRWKYRFMRAA